MQFGQAQRRRRPSLTPMIDVVFLLLVFFMLAARFGTDLQFPLQLGAGPAATWQGPPRLVDIRPEGLRLNGQPIAPEALAQALTRLMETDGDTIVLRAAKDVPLQGVVTVLESLATQGLTNVVLVD